MRRLVVVVCLVIACGGPERPPAVEIAREPARPVETVDGSLLTPTKPPRPTGEACVMLYECGCNAGCTKVDQPMDALAPNMQVHIASGSLKGTNVFVAKQKTDTGESIFTVQRTDPNAPIQICGIPHSSVMGYLCGTSNLTGPRACSSCE
jgi:hypothetical protein